MFLSQHSSPIYPIAWYINKRHSSPRAIQVKQWKPSIIYKCKILLALMTLTAASAGDYLIWKVNLKLRNKDHSLVYGYPVVWHNLLKKQFFPQLNYLRTLFKNQFTTPSLQPPPSPNQLTTKMKVLTDLQFCFIDLNVYSEAITVAL